MMMVIEVVMVRVTMIGVCVGGGGGEREIGVRLVYY